ncbi:MAG TPA: immunity 22 family protein [Gemmataceae bacterium]
MRETETSHFWVGRFTEEKATEYFTEVWDENDEDREHTPLSAFARDQGVKWYDHDFIEYGFKKGARSTEELVAGYSYSDQWAVELARRAAAESLRGVNFFVFISEEEIDSPRSVKGDGYWLQYLGTIKYRI